MSHTLLVTVDGGSQTRRIAELARRAAAPGTRVHLLCAVDVGYALPGRSTLLDYPPAAHECEEVRQVPNEARALLAGCELEVWVELRTGDPVQVILGEARRLSCELIVTGHRYLGRLERLLDPSVGDRVIREAPCLVLVEVCEEDAQGSRPADRLSPPCGSSHGYGGQDVDGFLARLLGKQPDRLPSGRD